MLKKQLNKFNLITIILNKRAYHEYFIEQTLEAGIVLHGWEVQSLRACKVNINNSYIILKHGEAFLLGANFEPILSASDCSVDKSKVTHKLLLHYKELNLLSDRIKNKHYTATAMSLYWKNAWCKVKIGIAKGKKQHDKRRAVKECEWQLNKARIIKRINN